MRDGDESLPDTVPVSLSQSDDVSEDVRGLQRQDALAFWGRAQTAPAPVQIVRRDHTERDWLRKSR